MTLAADLSQLPSAAKQTEGEPPDKTPRFVQLLVEEMARNNAEAGDKPTAFGTRIRHSDAGKCARAIAYSAAGIPKSDPMDLAGVWVTSLGTLIHEAWQEALQKAFPGAQIEPKLRIDGLDASGHADAILDWPCDCIDEAPRYSNLGPDHDGSPDPCSVCDDTGTARRILIELKTGGGFAHKLRIGERGLAQGPSHEHKLQAALNADAVNADEVVIAYMATEAISLGAAGRKGLSELERFAGEWSYSREQFEPWAQAEQKRLQGILDLLDKGELAARKVPNPEMPPGAEIVDVASSRWELRQAGKIVDTGSMWGGQFCSYCPYHSTCALTNPGRIPLTDVTGKDAA